MEKVKKRKTAEIVSTVTEIEEKISNQKVEARTIKEQTHHIFLKKTSCPVLHSSIVLEYK